MEWDRVFDERKSEIIALAKDYKVSIEGQEQLKKLAAAFVHIPG